jgi:hypothetical protein
MKAYIKENIKCKCQKEDLPFLKECSTIYTLLDTELEEKWMCEIEIKEQKIVLTEYDMNGIFELFLYDSRIKYKSIGGLGDDFAIDVYNSI